MTKTAIFRILVLIGVCNALTLVISAANGTNNYSLANDISEYFDFILCYIPLVLMGISIVWNLVERIANVEKRENHFVLAFIAILPDGVFIIGSALFASGK